MNTDKKLDLLVVYEAAGDELRDNHAKAAETLESAKARVLIAFGLSEGDDHGKLTTYSLFHNEHELKDLSRTIGDVAGGAELLVLELARERYRFFYTDHKILSELETATGAQIKTMIKAKVPAFDPQHELILEGHGSHPDRVIPDAERVSLEVGEGHPVKHFYSKPPTSFGAP